jgi:hypothetical protein
MSRFDPATPLESTPPFLRWTLALGCPLRDASDYFDPDHTERLLRGVRCASDAAAQGRVHEGIALQRQMNADDPRGFEIVAVLEPLGGEDFVRQTCTLCPANALAHGEPGALAGCVGHLVPPADQTELWLSLALSERPTRDELKDQHQRLSAFSAADVIGLGDYLLAIETSLETELPLMVRAFPGGRCEGRRWYVEAHCDRCKSAWPEARRQQCRVCGQVGGRQAEQRRMRMGTRPYRPLREFLSSEQIAVLMTEKVG